MRKPTERDLKAELNDIRERFPRLADGELFVAWFLKCFVTENEREAVEALVGGPRDKNVDAVFLDEPSKTVFAVQGKYRQKIGHGRETRVNVIDFANLSRVFLDDELFASFRKKLEARTLAKLDEARKRIRASSYRLQLYYVTTGHCSAALSAEAERTVRLAAQNANIDIIDGRQVLRLLSDYLDGVAPPVPLLELEIEGGQGIKLGGILQRFDNRTGIASWVLPVGVLKWTPLVGPRGPVC